MSRGLGRLQREILDYVETKAKDSKLHHLKTVKVYADTAELSEKLHIPNNQICQAVDSLVRMNKLRIYPNNRKRNRYYGAMLLPEITFDEMLASTRAIVSKYE